MRPKNSLFFFAECRFGDQTFELEQTWHPDLGAPFGIMYCVHCECVPVSLNILRAYAVSFASAEGVL